MEPNASRDTTDNSPHNNQNAPGSEKGLGVPVQSQLCDAIEKTVQEYGGGLTASQKTMIEKATAGDVRSIRAIARAVAGGWPITPEMKAGVVGVVNTILFRGQKRVVRRGADGRDKVAFVEVGERTFTKAMDMMAKMVATNASLLPQIHQYDTGQATGPAPGALDLSKLSDEELDALEAMCASQANGV